MGPKGRTIGKQAGFSSHCLRRYTDTFVYKLRLLSFSYIIISHGVNRIRVHAGERLVDFFLSSFSHVYFLRKRLFMPEAILGGLEIMDRSASSEVERLLSRRFASWLR